MGKVGAELRVLGTLNPSTAFRGGLAGRKYSLTCVRLSPHRKEAGVKVAAVSGRD